MCHGRAEEKNWFNLFVFCWFCLIFFRIVAPCWPGNILIFRIVGIFFPGNNIRRKSIIVCLTYWLCLFQSIFNQFWKIRKHGFHQSVIRVIGFTLGNLWLGFQNFIRYEPTGHSRARNHIYWTKPKICCEIRLCLFQIHNAQSTSHCSGLLNNNAEFCIYDFYDFIK